MLFEINFLSMLLKNNAADGKLNLEELLINSDVKKLGTKIISDLNT